MGDTLDLGQLSAEVTLITTPFDAAYTRVLAKMRELGVKVGAAAASFDALDEGLASVGAAAEKAAVGMERATKATTTSSAAATKATESESRQADALLRVQAVMGRVTVDAQRMQQVELRLLATQERYNTLVEGGTATTGQLASAQAALIGAQRAMDRAQEQSAGRMSTLTGSMDAQAASLARVEALMTQYAGESVRVQRAALDAAAAQGRLEEVQATGTATARQLATAQSAVLAANERLAKSSESLSTRVGAAGKKLTTSVTLPIALAAGVSIDLASKFQQATNVYVTAAGESEKNLGAVRAGIKRVAVETGTSINQLTAAEYVAEKAHLRGAAGITVLEAAAKGAREENANLADVMQGETSIMASYHLKANQAVAVMNALKTGAGSAKAPMEDYVRALSTVIPVASAAGISVQEMLGAYSTLTQHGTSPAEATQELANTIRNLQAPSNVAISAMNQLGISSVNVGKNLGKRGLSGTIEDIEAKLPKSGLVYLSTMKQMEAGTKDLTAMQSKMSPQLAQLSKGFLDNSVSAKSYRAGIRDLGADGYAQGTQFLELARKVKGYNDSIKNGTPAQKTMAAELKALFGGATGLNTVLQLGGQNLDGFKGRVEAVGKSLGDTTGDVEGWSSTSQLASVKADQLKASLHVLAIDGGNALLPMFTKAVSGADSLVHGISGLSHTQKEILGWSAVTLAAAGPVMAIFARVRTAIAAVIALPDKLVAMGSRMVGFFTSTSSAAAAAAAVEATTAADFATAEAAKAAAVAEAAAAIAVSVEGTDSILAAGASQAAIDASAFAVAEQAKADAAVTAAATITAASEEAGAASSLALGPVGVAIGAVVGVGALAAHALGLFSDSAKAAVKPTDALTAAITRDNLALGQNTRAQVTQDLDKKAGGGGALFTQASSLGINPHELTNAALGVKADRDKANAILSKLTAQNFGIAGRGVPVASALTASLLGVKQGVQLTGGDVDKLRNILNMADSVRTSLKLENATALASLKNAKQLAEANSLAGKAETARTKELKQIPGLQKAAASSLDKLNVSVAQYGATLKAGTKGGDANTAILRKSIQSYDAVAKAQLATGTSLKTVTANLDAGAAAFTKQTTAAGFNSKAVDGLLAKYKLTPKQLVTEMVANIDKGTASAAQLQHILDAVHQGKIPGLTADSTQGLAVAKALQGRIDSLHQSVAPTVTVHDGASRQLAIIRSNLAALHNKSIDINTYVQNVVLPDVVNDPSRKGGRRKRVGALGYIGYSQGGIEDHSAAIYQPIAGHVRVFAEPETQGESYIPLANDGRRPRARAIAKETVRRLGGVATFDGGGITHVGKDWIYDGIRYASKRAAENAETRAGRKSSKSLTQLNSDAHGLYGLEDRGDLGSLRSGLKSVNADLLAAGVPRAFINGLKADDDAIVAVTAVRTKAAANLAKANAALAAARKIMADDRASFTGAVNGTFDISTAGAGLDGKVTGSGILAQQAQAVARARAFVTGLEKLIGKKIFPGAYIRSLAGKGPDALPEINALLGLSASQMRSLAVENGQLNALGAQIGGVASQRLDGGAVARDAKAAAAAQKAEDRAEQQLARVMSKFANDITGELGHRLDGISAATESVVDEFARGVHLITRNGQLYLAVETDRKKLQNTRGTAH